jgi:glucose dehydrogenase
VVWQFQVVHHDIWDYDVASQPMLIDLKRNGRTIPAVAVGTKMGMLFILDRRNGKPVFPITILCDATLSNIAATARSASTQTGTSLGIE